MGEGRSVAQRKADVLATLDKNVDVWLATSDKSGRPCLIAVSSWWDGKSLVIATRGSSPTAKNLASVGLARLAAGSTDDVVMIEAHVSQHLPVSDAPADLRTGFVNAVGWDPAEEGNDWKLFRLMPVQVQAYRGYGELNGRTIMRDARWLV